MLFPTLAFHLFFVAVFLFSWSLRGSAEWQIEWRKIGLLVASWIFYGAWDWRFVSLLLLSSALNWIAGNAIHANEGQQGRQKLWLTAGLVFNLGVLGLFKYYNFFVLQLAPVLTSMGWERDLPVLEIILPVGVSFFTFQGIGYLVDIYRRDTPPARLLDLTLLMCFFPHLLAGPIVRPTHLIPQFQTAPRLTREMVAMGLLLIVWGVFKKAVIASEISIAFVDPLFADPAKHGSLDLLLGAYAYAVQIYCDFSAYTDTAIGLAALLGYRFPRNFDQPYRAASLQDFWRRWHISLSSWLRDYLYIPLGGSRHGLARTCLSLGLTMVLGGLWHGASWNFVIWGMIHGGMLIAERLWKEFRPANLPHVPHWLGVVFTFHIVTLAWIFFRCASFADSMAYLGGLAALAPGAVTAGPLVVGLMLLGMGLHFGPPRLMPAIALRLRLAPAWAVALLLAGCLMLVEAMRPDGVAPFIYFQF
ncbi:MBOAT family protein [Novosphingobium sp. FSY-8]|uniref:Probable alginate O-acetylase AlgI n=1 Tax=Novosphingobium ovatum TaxID=1908523 RepID=A0ABW9XA89_9SPHN|nr:MBOAT family protein [Novosphingobium ovatum]NBC35432.1 MBOAT family protein [Novosphingobium ovatum]